MNIWQEQKAWWDYLLGLGIPGDILAGIVWVIFDLHTDLEKIWKYLIRETSTLKIVGVNPTIDHD
jgi:hypothetical protein